MRALITMMADIDLERIGKCREIDLVGAEEEGELRLGRDHILDPAGQAVTEHQRTHARGREMHDVEAVPAIFHRVHPLGDSEARAVSPGPRPDERTGWQNGDS